MSKNISFHVVIDKIALNLSSSIYGFVYVSKKGNYHTILNGNINYETQRSVFLHEIKHIIYDIPTIGYIIGFDMQYEKFENNKLY